MTALEARFTVAVEGEDRTFSLDVEIALQTGVLVLFGPSGAGKSLTLRALAGLLPGVRGRVVVAGEVLLDSERGVTLPAERRRLGYVPQQHALFPFLDVAGNVAFGLPRRQRRAEVVAGLLDELGLGSLSAARPASLSGGERQRVALGRALAVAPRMLLLDEPFASLDEEGRGSLQKLVRAVIDRRGIPAVLVTHHPGEAVAMGDWLARFEQGRVVAAGAPRALLTRPDAVTITGLRRGAVRSMGEGRARLHLEEAIVEGAEALLQGPEGEPLRIEATVAEVAKPTT